MLMQMFIQKNGFIFSYDVAFTYSNIKKFLDGQWKVKYCPIYTFKLSDKNLLPMFIQGGKSIIVYEISSLQLAFYAAVNDSGAALQNNNND